MKAVLRRIRISPKKANLVAGLVRGKTVKEALAILKFTPKKGAKILYKVLHSAASNAKNNFKQSMDDLVVSKILVTKGPTYKRSVPISRGRVHPIRKRTCHITVEVGLPEGARVKKPVKKEEKAVQPAESAEKPVKEVVKKEEKRLKTPKKKTVKKAPSKKASK
ncbi:50S ribosomal protein L22 [Candidatus Peregrinibacteria bacterium]|nr:50S ribosomal protein L22 [Candidatus Peregrinibacteria bacterium]